MPKQHDFGNEISYRGVQRSLTFFAHLKLFISNDRSFCDIASVVIRAQSKESSSGIYHSIEQSTIWQDKRNQRRNDTFLIRTTSMRCEHHKIGLNPFRAREMERTKENFHSLRTCKMQRFCSRKVNQFHSLSFDFDALARWLSFILRMNKSNVASFSRIKTVHVYGAHTHKYC